MAKVVETIGSTYDEALQNGLNQLGLTEEEVNIEIVKDESSAKKSFFNILEPRQVKLRISEKNSRTHENAQKEKEIVELDNDTVEQAKSKIGAFMDEFIKTMNLSLTYEIKYEKGYIFVTLSGENSGLIIGHRGETLEALQVIVTSILNKNQDKRIRVIFDSENYREKRAETLKGLALREAEQVIRRKKNYTFEPMSAFERKAIHSALQDNPRVTTFSVGEEPYRKVVIALKNN